MPSFPTNKTGGLKQGHRRRGLGGQLLLDQGGSNEQVGPIASAIENRAAREVYLGGSWVIKQK